MLKQFSNQDQQGVNAAGPRKVVTGLGTLEVYLVFVPYKYVWSLYHIRMSGLCTMEVYLVFVPRKYISGMEFLVFVTI